MSKILVIDSSSEARSAVAAVLSQAQHEVHTFEDGLRGIESALREPPDLVLCEIGKGAQDGFGVLAALRGNPATTNLPFIFLADRDDQANFRNAMNYGADDYLVKPIMPRDFMFAVDRCLKRQRKEAPRSLSGRFAREVVGDGPAWTARLGRLVDNLQPAEAVTSDARFGTILFFDIRGFTTYSERLTPTEVAELLHQFFTKACEPVVQQGGWIVKMMGDAVLALFEPDQRWPEHHALRALRAGLLVVLAASRFRGWIRDRFPGQVLPEFAVGVGAHAGNAVVCGMAGESKEAPTLIGDAVNVAARLEDMTRELGWSIVTSRSTLAMAGGRIESGRSSTTSLKGRTASIEAVEVTGLSPRAAGTGDDDGFYHTLRQAVIANAKAVEHDHTNDGALPRGVPGVGGYRLKRRLGKGSAATIYLAEPVAGGESCVLKLIEINKDSPDAMEMLDRFVQEYALLSQIRHRNVVEIRGQGFTGTHAYIAMEHLAGGDLRVVARQGAQPRQALAYLRQTAAALDAIHRVGVIHRDLKPDNLMLRADGTLVLADFGIARHLSRALIRTRHGEVFGTPQYISPEQILGNPADARSDLYSLGVLFFQLLTGSLPYYAQDTAGLLGMHVNAPIPRLPDELAALQPLLDGLMAKNPAQRYAGARELLDALPGFEADSACFAGRAVA